MHEPTRDRVEAVAVYGLAALMLYAQDRQQAKVASTLGGCASVGIRYAGRVRASSS